MFKPQLTKVSKNKLLNFFSTAYCLNISEILSHKIDPVTFDYTIRVFWFSPTQRNCGIIDISNRHIKRFPRNCT